MKRSAVVKRVVALLTTFVFLSGASSYASASVEASWAADDHVIVVVPTMEQYFEAQAHMAIRSVANDAIESQLSLENALEQVGGLVRLVKPVAGVDEVAPLAGMSFTERAAQ